MSCIVRDHQVMTDQCKIVME